MSYSQIYMWIKHTHLYWFQNIFFHFKFVAFLNLTCPLCSARYSQCFVWCLYQGCKCISCLDLTELQDSQCNVISLKCNNNSVVYLLCFIVCLFTIVYQILISSWCTTLQWYTYTFPACLRCYLCTSCWTLSLAISYVQYCKHLLLYIWMVPTFMCTQYHYILLLYKYQKTHRLCYDPYN